MTTSNNAAGGRMLGKLRRVAYLLAYTVVGVVGCSRSGAALPTPVRTALEQGDPFVLLSLQPGPEDLNGPFHGYQVLGQTTVTDPAQRQALLQALYVGVDENNGWVRTSNKCFLPRHGIHVVREGQAVDLVICFQCYQIEAYVGKQRTQTLVSRSPQALFDRMLREAAVPLATPPAE